MKVVEPESEDPEEFTQGQGYQGIGCQQRDRELARTG